ncbi:MAG: FtsH protease activity modulator HflK [Alphaproteobacteria bacterium]|nr:FtsH protease activity modulator HflK [Alphaproteobacteria bacterium]
MSWNDNNGPWGPSGNKSGGAGGNKPGDDNPWMRKNAGGPPNTFAPPPDIEELLKKLREWLKPLRPNGHGQIIAFVILAIIGIWLASGVYQVSSNQLGVVMRFGAFNRTEQPGLRYHLPSPIEEVLLPIVTSQNEIQIGFRRISRSSDDVRSIPEESMMLTQDENIINVEFAVFWRINDVNKYLFEIRDPEMTVKMAAESAMREVIGQNKLQFALTDGRGQIAEEAKSRLQELMDEYNVGVVITQINLQTVSVPDEVKAAFQDVVNARLDQERFQNQAAAHANKVIPESKGQAAKLIQEAMGYRDQKIAIAQGDAERFKEVLSAYNMSRDVTSKRLYLETMEAVLGSANKIIMSKSGSGAVPYMPLNDMLRNNKPSPAESGEGAKR